MRQNVWSPANTAQFESKFWRPLAMTHRSSRHSNDMEWGRFRPFGDEVESGTNCRVNLTVKTHETAGKSLFVSVCD